MVELNPGEFYQVEFCPRGFYLGILVRPWRSNASSKKWKDKMNKSQTEKTAEGSQQNFSTAKLKIWPKQILQNPIVQSTVKITNTLQTVQTLLYKIFRNIISKSRKTGPYKTFPKIVLKLVLKKPLLKVLIVPETDRETSNGLKTFLGLLKPDDNR